MEEGNRGCEKSKRSNHNLEIVMEQDNFNVISAYAPQVGLVKNLKMKFWEDLKSLLQDIP